MFSPKRLVCTDTYAYLHAQHVRRFPFIAKTDYLSPESDDRRAFVVRTFRVWGEGRGQIIECGPAQIYSS